MIEFQNVTVEQGKTILRDLSFTIKKQEKAVLYGPSGSGKSTILRTLLGGYHPVRGRIIFDGLPVDKNSIHVIRKKIAYIGQEPVLGETTVEHALLLPFTFKANALYRPDKSALISALERVGLPSSILSSETASVSGGEKQRIAVARVLLLDKKVFCIDEITSALDSGSVDSVLSLFRDEQITILSVSHDPRWLDIANRFIKIDNGTVVDDTRERFRVKM